MRSVLFFYILYQCYIMEYEFCDMNLANVDDINNVHDFLSKNYYLHDDEFRLAYSVEQIRWIFSLTDVANDNDRFCFAYVIKNTKIIVGFILGVFVKFIINNEERKMSEVSLLCAHNKLRKKNFAKIIVDEYVRRYGIYIGYPEEAIYIGSRLLPQPHTLIGHSRYYHRPLNLPMLLECDFTSCEPYKSKKEKISALRLNANYKNLYALTMDDVKDACDHLMRYLKRFELYPIYDADHFTNTFLNNDFVKCYTYKAKSDGPILDIISYYNLPMTKTDNTTRINTAYLFYYSNNSGHLTDMVRNLMIKLRNEQYHLFNALNIMENETFLDELHFEEGTGEPYYFIYNQATNTVPLLPNQIGKIIF